MTRSPVVAALALCVASPLAAQERQIELKASLWVPPSHPILVSTKEWAADIEKQSGGTIKVTVFPSEQLGKAFDHYDMARDGLADVTYVNPGYQPGRFPIVALGQLPFTFTDGRKGTAALDAWYRKYAPGEMKDTHYCLAFIHDPGTFHSRKKIVVPDDVRGTKVRPAQSTIGQMVTMLGGTNVQASAPESRDMLERGVADAITFPWGSIFLFGIDKVVKYHLDVPLYTTLATFNINRAKYDAMSPAQRKVIDDHCTTEWAVRLVGPWIDFEAAGRAKMKAAPGHEISTLTPDQLTLWQKTVEPLKQNWVESVRKAGGDPDAMAREMNEALATYDAGF